MNTSPISELSLAQLQAAFVSMQPRILRHAQIYFRHLRCPHRRADCIAEAIALCWKWFLRLARRGKDARQFPSVLAAYAARAVRNGRKVCGQIRARDVMNEMAQQRHRFRVESLPAATTTNHETLYGLVDGQRRLDTFEQRLQDNTRSPVPDQVAFRVDFRDWLALWTDRDRRIIEDMARNERTMDLARKYRISEGRISQLRRQFQADWERFVADPGDSKGLGPVTA